MADSAHNQQELQRTALIPFWARVDDSEAENSILRSTAARRLAPEIEKRYGRLSPDAKTRLVCCLRNLVVDNWLKSIVRPDEPCTIVEIGIGLNDREDRLGLTSATWIEVDFPGIIKVRNELFGQKKNVARIAASALDFKTWSTNVPLKPAAKAVFVIEGVLFYLQKREALGLLSFIATTYPGAFIIFDTIAFPARYLGNKYPREIEGRPDYCWSIWSTRRLGKYMRPFRIISETGLQEARDKLFASSGAETRTFFKLPVMRRLYRLTLAQV